MNQSEKSDTPNVQYEIADPAVMAITPVVSVNMITYDHGPYLAEAIEGVIAQKTDFPIELVICEDCSTDNSREIALDYQRRYPHLIRVIYSDRNVGMMANARRVRLACRGEFMAFCEGDDYWINPDKLREQVAVLSRLQDIDLTFHSCYITYGKQPKPKRFLSHVRSSTDKVIPLSEVIAGDGGFMPTAGLVIRRSVLMSAQDWFDEIKPPVGDYFFQVFGSRRGGAYYINKPMCVWRRGLEESWCGRKDGSEDLTVKFQREFYFSLKKLEELIPGQEKAFNRLMVSNFFNHFLIAKQRNFSQLEELTSWVLKDRMNKLSFLQKIKVLSLQNNIFIKLHIEYSKMPYRVNKLFTMLGFK